MKKSLWTRFVDAASVAFANLIDAVKDRRTKAAMVDGVVENPNKDEEVAPDSLQPATIAELMEMSGLPPVAEEPPATTDKSQILGAEGSEFIYMNPRPLHPRAIEGEEIRVHPPVPLRTPADLYALLQMGSREAVMRDDDCGAS